jgi:hypothetical protein
MAIRRRSRPGDDLHVGSRVLYQLPGGLVEAEVVEDRGNIGVNGRRLLRILPLDEDLDGPITWPAEELTSAE